MFRAYGGLLRLAFKFQGKHVMWGSEDAFFRKRSIFSRIWNCFVTHGAVWESLIWAGRIAGTMKTVVKDRAKCVPGGRAGSAFSRHGRNLQNQEYFVQNFFCTAFIPYDCFITCTHCDRRVFKIHKAASTSI